MPTIIALRNCPRRPGRIELHLDGLAPFALPAEQVAGLVVGQELAIGEADRLRFEGELDRATDTSLRFIAVRPRSKSEVATRLRRAGVGEDAVACVIERLEGKDLVDDALFARWWVEDRCAHRPRSRRALAVELGQHGVDRETVTGALADLDDDTLARTAAVERACRYGGLDRRAFDARLGGWLSRRGFAASAVLAALDAAWRELHERSD